jgi:four helix bundle protein
MAKMFEEIEVWQLARVLVKEIYRITSNVEMNKNHSLKDQIQRAALSIMNNISEGFERHSDREFANFLNIAKGSAGEVRSMLFVMLDLHYIDNESFQDCYTQTTTISKSLAGFITYLKNKPVQSK